MELPLFYGRDASNCVNECEKFALSHRIYGLDMVDVAFNHMRGLALQWHQNFMRISGDRGKPSWNEYMNVPNVSFGKESEEPLYKLLKLRQNGRVREYQTEFYALAAWTNLNEQQLINTFIGGLRVEIALKVKSMQPTLLYHALCLAKLEESKIEYLAKQLNNSKLPLLPIPKPIQPIVRPFETSYPEPINQTHAEVRHKCEDEYLLSDMHLKVSYKSDLQASQVVEIRQGCETNRISESDGKQTREYTLTQATLEEQMSSAVATDQKKRGDEPLILPLQLKNCHEYGHVDGQEAEDNPSLKPPDVKQVQKLDGSLIESDFANLNSVKATSLEEKVNISNIKTIRVLTHQVLSYDSKDQPTAERLLYVTDEMKLLRDIGQENTKDVDPTTRLHHILRPPEVLLSKGHLKWINSAAQRHLQQIIVYGEIEAGLKGAYRHVGMVAAQVECKYQGIFSQGNKLLQSTARNCKFRSSWSNNELIVDGNDMNIMLMLQQNWERHEDHNLTREVKKDTRACRVWFDRGRPSEIYYKLDTTPTTIDYILEDKDKFKGEGVVTGENEWIRELVILSGKSNNDNIGFKMQLLSVFENGGKQLGTRKARADWKGALDTCWARVAAPD